MRSLIRVAIGILLIVALGASHAKQTPPKGGPPRDFNLPNVERLTLDNGMKVTLVPFGNIPKTSIRVNVRTGNLNEGKDTWLSDLTGELIKEGTQLRSAELIAKQTARMGGQLSLGTGLDQTTMGISVLEEYAVNAIGLIAESLRQPALPESQLERIRTGLVRNLSLALSQPQAIAASAFYELMYDDHPYGVAYPQEAQLQSYTIEQVQDYYAENFGAQRSHILVAGRFNRDDVLHAIHTQFGDWRKGPKILENPPVVRSDFRLKLIDQPDAPQSTVMIGLPAPIAGDTDSLAFAQMQTLLGGYFSSRITANIREDKGYTYSPRGRVSQRVGTALWIQSASITTEHTAAAIHEILKEVQLMQNEAPSDIEVERTQSYQTGTFVLSHATPGGLLARLSAIELHQLPHSYLQGYLSTINSFDAQKHQEMAQKHLLIDHATIVVVGDIEKIRDSLMQVPQLSGIAIIE